MADLNSAISAAMAPAVPKAGDTPKASVEVKEASPVDPKAKEVPSTTQKAKEPQKASETPPEAKRHKLKVDNEEIEVDEEELKRGYAHNKAASKRMEEAAAYRKQAEQAFAMLKDPAQLRKLLEDPRVGIDLRKFAEEYVWEHMQEEALTPEQKKQKAVERELEKYRTSEKERAEAAERTESDKLQQRYAEDYERTILQALDQGGIPKTRASVRRMAQYLQLAVANNLEVSPGDLVARVKQDLIDEHKSMYGEGDAASLLSILGEDLAKKIREADLKRLKSTQPVARQRAPGTAKPAKKPEGRRETISADKLREMLTEKLGK